MSKYKILHFKSLPSTQDMAKEFTKKYLENIVVVADSQTKARGRFNRKWHSKKGGLWFSILIKTKNIENIQYITFISALSVVKSIKQIAKLETKIKWPNDVHYMGKKLCGILTESILGNENLIIIGVGLNLNQSYFANEIKNIATSLKIIKNKNFSKDLFLKNILTNFADIYENKYKKNKLKFILKSWKRNSDTLGKDVEVLTKNGVLTGKAVGIDKNCSLIIKLKNRKLFSVIEGDVKIRDYHK